MPPGLGAGASGSQNKRITMTQAFKTVFAAATLGLLSVLPTSAAVVSVVANAPESWALVDLNQTTTITGTWTDAPAIVAGSQSGKYKSPFDPKLADGGIDVPAEDAIPNWQAIKYFTVGSPDPNLAPSPAIMTFSEKQSYLSLLWGSIDEYNSLAFYLNGVLQSTVTGGYLLANGGQPAASGAAFVKVAEDFNEIRFFSNYGLLKDQAAFEFSNVVAAVPVPAGGLLLIGALGGLAALRRRKTA
jgi:hypothetical protein